MESVRDFGVGKDTAEPDGQVKLPWREGDMMLTLRMEGGASLTLRASGGFGLFLSDYLNLRARDADEPPCGITTCVHSPLTESLDRTSAQGPSLN